MLTFNRADDTEEGVISFYIMFAIYVSLLIFVIYKLVIIQKVRKKRKHIVLMCYYASVG